MSVVLDSKVSASGLSQGLSKSADHHPISPDGLLLYALRSAGSTNGRARDYTVVSKFARVLRRPYSHRGRRTKARSCKRACGTVKRSSRTVRSWYPMMSRSMFLGPLSITLTRPSLFSIPCNRSRSTNGSSDVSNYGILAHLGVYCTGDSTTSQAPFTKSS